MTSHNKLRVGVVGVGYFGRFHALKAAAHQREELVGVFDKDLERANIVAAEVGCKVYKTLETLLDDIDAVVIATPASTHSDIACIALNAQKHVLVEKPLATDMKQAERIKRLAVDNQCVCHVGYLLCYSLEQEILWAHVQNPLRLFFERSTKASNRGRDVSVILDLMIHDLNYLSSIKNLGEISNIEIDTISVDKAKLYLTFSNGCRVDLIADRNAKNPEQRIYAYSKEKYVKIDALKHHGYVVEAFDKKEDRAPQFMEWDKQDLLFKEHDIFVEACLDHKVIGSDVGCAMRTQELAEHIISALLTN